MSRTRVRRRRAALGAAVLLGGLWAGTAAHAGSQHPTPEYRKYVIRSGDTLWDIAEHVAGSEGDPRPVIDAIEDANSLEGALQPGDVLRIPVTD